MSAQGILCILILLQYNSLTPINPSSCECPCYYGRYGHSMESLASQNKTIVDCYGSEAICLLQLRICKAIPDELEL